MLYNVVYSIIYIFYPLHGYQALSTDFGPARLKFPVFEIINMAMTFTAFSPGVSALPQNRFFWALELQLCGRGGFISGFLFCTVMLPVAASEYLWHLHTTIHRFFFSKTCAVTMMSLGNQTWQWKIPHLVR